MPRRKRYGALLFLPDRRGRQSAVAFTSANYPIEAISAAGMLRAELIEKIVGGLGQVAFEWTEGKRCENPLIYLLKTGTLPSDDSLASVIAVNMSRPKIRRKKRMIPIEKKRQYSRIGLVRVGTRA